MYLRGVCLTPPPRCRPPSDVKPPWMHTHPQMHTHPPPRCTPPEADPPPSDKTNTCENITLPQTKLRLRAVIIKKYLEIYFKQECIPVRGGSPCFGGVSLPGGGLLARGASLPGGCPCQGGFSLPETPLCGQNHRHE